MGALWLEWSRWLQEGYFISYRIGAVTYYEHIMQRDIAHWKYTWFEAIESLHDSGHIVPDDLIVTAGYDRNNNTNHIWQVIFGIRGQAYIYIELPTDRHRHGIPKIPKPSSAMREVSHFTEAMSDYNEPEFVTEMIMMKPGYDRVALSAYNPQDITLRPDLNFFINRMITERIGTEQAGVLTPVDAERWKTTLDLLYKRQIPYKPLTLSPVWAPEAEQ